MKSKLTAFLLSCFSIYYWSICFLWMSLVFLASCIFSLVLPPKKIFDWFTAPGLKVCIFLGFNTIKVTYDKDFNPNQQSVFCQNHVNFLDAHVAAASIPHVICGLMHAWQFKIPVYGWIMALSKGIKVFPEKKNNLDLMTRQAKRRKDIGFSILVFPEGGRTRDGKVHKFRRGVFRMARDAGFPVVPVAVRGSFPINRKGTMLFSPFHTIDVFVGPQFQTQGLADHELETLAHSMQERVSSFVEAA